MAGKRVQDLAAIVIIMGTLILTAILLPRLMGPFQGSGTGYTGATGSARQVDEDEIEIEVEISFTRSVQVTDDRITPAKSELTEELAADVKDLDVVKQYVSQGYGVKWIKPLEIGFHYEFGDNGWMAHDNGHEWRVWVLGSYIDGYYKSGVEADDREYRLTLGEFSTSKLSVKIYVMAKAEWHTAKAWTIVRDVAVELVVRLQLGYQEPGDDGSGGNGSGGGGNGGGGQPGTAMLRVFVSYYYYQAGARQAADGAIVRLYDTSGSLVAEKVATKYDEERALAEFNVPYGEYDVQIETDLGSTSTTVMVNEDPEEVQMDIPCGMSWVVVATTASVAGLALLALLALRLTARKRRRRVRKL